MSSVKVETEVLEGRKAKLTVEIEASEFEDAINKVYKRQKNRISIPGFRKGKVPRKVIEKMYGEDIFCDEAADNLVQEKYPEVYELCEEDIVSAPEIEVTQMEAGKPLIFTALVALRPEVKLCEYKGVEVTAIDTSVSEEEIDQEIENERKTNSRMITVDEPAKEGDTVVIDYEGFANGVAFDGGKAEGHPLELGSNSFIPGFEEQLIGASAGDDIDVSVTFPEQYHAPELAGKDAVFIVKVHEVRRNEMPEIDDEYIEDIGFDSMDEYREELKERIEKKKTDEAHRKQEDEAIGYIAENSEIDVPEEMIETQLNSTLNDYANNVMQSGISFSEYLKMTGMTVEKMKNQLRPETVERVRASLVIEEIAKNENVEVSDDEVEAKLQETADMYHMPLEDLKKDLPDSQVDSLREQISFEKAIDIVMDNINPVEKEEEEN